VKKHDLDLRKKESSKFWGKGETSGKKKSLTNDHHRASTKVITVPWRRGEKEDAIK